MTCQCQWPCENKTEYGYCKTTYCINPQFGNLGTWQQTILQHGTLKLKQQTNADRIRSMSDEELGELLNSIQGDAYLVGFNTRAESRYTPYGKSWLDWLRQEVEK